jgi:hypothetical protein
MAGKGALMEKFVAQRGEFCLLTMQGYAEVMESPHFLPVALAGWAPENDYVVGYIEGESIYRLVDEGTWLNALKEYRQRQLNNVLDSLKQRGLFEDRHDPSGQQAS